MKYFTELLFLRFHANLSRASACGITQGLAGASATVWAAKCHWNVAKIVTDVTAVLVNREVLCFFSPNKYDNNKISQLICWLN